MFDAYTVKKVFPRLAIAMVLIQLSWPIFTFMIFVVSQIAWGVEGLMYAPFGGRDAFDIGEMVGVAVNAGKPGGGGSPELLIGTLLGATGVIGYGIALGAGGLLALGVTVLLSVFIAFFVLAVRQVVIVVLLVLSPIALAAWILPNTEKIWKLWWENFSKLLFMYPLILMLIAGGKIGAYIAAQVSAESSMNDAFGMAIVIIVFFAPYFLIPKTFQLAGSAFAGIANVANNKSRGAFDRLKNFRGQQISQRHQDRMAGKTGILGSRGGNAYRRVMSGGKDGAWSVTRGGRRRYHEARNLQTVQTADKALEEGGAYSFNDDYASRAALWSNNRDEFIRNYSNYVNEDRARQGLGALSEAESLAGAQAALGRVETATGLRMGTGAMKAAAGKFRVAQSNTAYESGTAGLDMMREEMASLREQGLTTEYDQAGWMKSSRGRTEFSGNGFNDTVNFLTGAGGTTSADQLRGAFKGADPREVLGGHQRSVVSFAEVAQQNFDNAVAEADAAAASGDATRIYQAEKQLDIAAADIAGIYDSLGHVSPNKAQEFADNVLERGVVSRGTTVRALIEERRERAPGPNGEQPFLDRRRELSARGRAHEFYDGPGGLGDGPLGGPPAES